MKITKDVIFPFLMYSQPFEYNNQITLYPVLMKDVLMFQIYSQAITVRKNSRFPNKQIIKMSYLEFLIYAAINPDLCSQFNITDIPELQNYYFYALALLTLVCKDQEVKYQPNGVIEINGCLITPEIFDDLRRIIIYQNDIDFDIDDFMNYDTEQRLKKAQKDLDKNCDKATMEDYIDSLCIGLHLTEDEVMNMPIRKFWRYIKRFNLHENYTIMRTGECSGMVSFKEPIKHWMISLDEDDKYKDLKTDENELRGKMG